MGTAISQDGTAIAYEQSGTGPALVLVSGTLDRFANMQLAGLLASHFTVLRYDRRGHGESGDTQPWSLEREVEDVAAVVGVAGGTAGLFGSSGNGVFTLEAAQRLSGRITKVAVWEPPYIVDNSRPVVPADYQAQLAALLAEGRRGDMVELFLTTTVRMPSEVVSAMREQPFWNAFEGVAHTLCYDAAITGDFSLPAERMGALSTPTLIIDGGTTSWLQQGAQRLSEALPKAERRTLSGQAHNVDPAALAPILLAFFAS